MGSEYRETALSRPVEDPILTHGDVEEGVNQISGNLEFSDRTLSKRNRRRITSVLSMKSLPVISTSGEYTYSPSPLPDLGEISAQESGIRMDSMSLPIEGQFLDEDFLAESEKDWMEQVLLHRQLRNAMAGNNEEPLESRNGGEAIMDLDKDRVIHPSRQSRVGLAQEIELVLDPSPMALIASSHQYSGQESCKRKDIQPNVGLTGHHIVCFPPYTWRGFFIHLLPILMAAISIIIFALPLPIMTAMPEARKCLGILIAVSILWSTEAIPIFVTALLIPIPVVLLQVLVSGTCSDSERETTLECISDSVCQAYVDVKSICEYTKPLSRYEAATVIFQQYFGPIIMLILSVFAIAAALRKTELDHRLSRFVLNRAGTRPSVIMLVMMLLGWFLSMWVSNITAAVITISLISPILKTLPSEEPYSRCVLLGIAFTCNIAGMTTPIASPQNLLATNSLSASTNVFITFPEWMAVASTTSLVAVICVFFFLWWFFKPTIAKLVPPTWQPQPIGIKHFFVITVTLATIGIWCAGTTTAVKNMIGDIGIVALMPVVLFYGSGLLSRQDYQLIPWEVLSLMGGGLALGYAIIKSRLLYGISQYLEMLVGNHLYPSILAFGLLVWTFSNFVSHTAAAAIVMPVMATVGQVLEHPKMLILLTVMLDSAACALPISGFPNTIAFAEKNEEGDRYLNFKDYLKTGIPVGIFMLILVNSLGYGLAIALKM